MILTCPDCATRYFVDEAKLGPAGRKVRCASCGAAWRAELEPETLDLTPVASPLDAPPQPEGVVSAAEALPKSFRAQQEARRRTRQAVTAGVVWASLAAGFVILVLAAVVFRVQVVRIWPRTAGAYAAVSLPVNPLGLTPEGVQATPGLKDGRAMLFVKGAERNVEASSRFPAPLRVSLYDKSGVRLATHVAPVGGAPLKPGEARSFETAFSDPPLAGSQIGVDFIFPPAARAHTVNARREDPQASSVHLRGLQTASAPVAVAAKLAQPLPEGSPYALPAAASAQAAGGAQPLGGGL